MLILRQKLSNFVPPVWKLHNPYCHSLEHWFLEFFDQTKLAFKAKKSNIWRINTITLDRETYPLSIAPMAKTKEGNYFLDVDPIYFREILEYLRHGKIIAKDSVLLEGVKELANYFGLTGIYIRFSLILQIFGHSQIFPHLLWPA